MDSNELYNLKKKIEKAQKIENDINSLGSMQNIAYNGYVKSLTIASTYDNEPITVNLRDYNEANQILHEAIQKIRPLFEARFAAI